jgi:hypothetical protein
MITTGGSIRRSPSKWHVFDASAAPRGQAGLVAHLSITQAVNGVRGVHAFLPHDALEFT